MWLSVGSGSSVCAPTLVPFNAEPWLPGVNDPLALELEDCPPRRDRTVVGSSQPMLGSERDDAVETPCTPFADSVCDISGATRCE